MSKKLQQPSSPAKDILKGALAGLIGGLIATAAKSAAEKLYPPRTHGEPEPPALLAEKLGQPRKETGEKKVVEEGIHWVFGAAAGAAYGAIAEVYPQITGKYGANFGMTLMAVTHEGVLPALGLAAPPPEQEDREKRSEVVTHVVYGVVCETVRALVRKAL
jgi:putative membrane protein